MSDSWLVLGEGGDLERGFRWMGMVGNDLGWVWGLILVVVVVVVTRGIVEVGGLLSVDVAAVQILVGAGEGSAQVLCPGS